MVVRVADYVADFLASKGVNHIFMVVGGMSMHLNDAFGNHKSIKYTCTHHEQGAATAADAYARAQNTLGVACVTAGPGATNALTSVVTAHFDSVPLLVISGQTKASQIKHKGIRQFGIQGFDTLSVFLPVTKYAATITDTKKIKYYLERAFYEATSGRPGAVWLEIPVDVQGASMDPNSIEGFTPPSHEEKWEKEITQKLPSLIKMLSTSRRPLLMLGNGVHSAGEVKRALEFAQKLNIPTITSRLGTDIMPASNPLFTGHPGLYGTRPANFAVQNCDLYLSLGCRHCNSLTGYDYKDYAKNAKKISLDIDSGELEKPSFAIDLKINSHITPFLDAALKENLPKCKNSNWIKKCQYWQKQYPSCLPEYENEKKGINSYYFTDVLSGIIGEGDIVVLDTSSPFHVVSQSIKTKQGQKFITTGGLSGMGFGLPAAIGAARAKGAKRVICICGDGSLQMNIQELQTIKHHNLPVKLFVINNDGYLLIRHTQKTHMESHFVGESPKTGLSCPSLEKISHAYELSYSKVSESARLAAAITKTLSAPGPAVLEVISPFWQLVAPRVASEKLEDGSMVSKPFDDMYPFLPREIYEKESNFWKEDNKNKK